MSPADTAQAWPQIDRHVPATRPSLERAGAWTGSAAIACAPDPSRTPRRATAAPCYRALPPHRFAGSRAASGRAYGRLGSPVDNPLGQRTHVSGCTTTSGRGATSGNRCRMSDQASHLTGATPVAHHCVEMPCGLAAACTGLQTKARRPLTRSTRRSAAGAPSRRVRGPAPPARRCGHRASFADDLIERVPTLVMVRPSCPNPEATDSHIAWTLAGKSLHGQCAKL